MPKTVNRPRDDASAQQMQQGPNDVAEEMSGNQMGDAEAQDDPSEQQAPT